MTKWEPNNTQGRRLMKAKAWVAWQRGRIRQQAWRRAGVAVFGTWLWVVTLCSLFCQRGESESVCVYMCVGGGEGRIYTQESERCK